MAKVSLGYSEDQVAFLMARGRAEEAKRELIKSRALVSAAELGATLGVSRQAIHKGARAGRYFSLEVAGRSYFPAFFANTDLQTQGMRQVLSTLSEESAWGKWIFLTTPSGTLGGVTPLEALDRGKKESVLKAAAAYLER